MAAAKILLGSCVRQEPTVLTYHLKTLLNLDIPPGVEIEYAYVNDSGSTEVEDILYELLPGVQVLPSDPRPDKAIYNVGSTTHNWSAETFDHLAKQKQKLLDYAVENKFDFIFLVDTDLLLDRSTLKSALSTKKGLISSVFWTQWQNGNPDSLGPQVWLRNPYNQQGMGMSQGVFWKRLVDRKITRIYGGGACHLVHKSSLEKDIRYYPRLPGLPNDGMWQGEDRTFAILAQQLHQHQFADPWPDIFHAYHQHQRTDEALQNVFYALSGPPQTYAKYGDLVNFTLESLEEPALKDKFFPVRGRLGGLEMVPNLEALLLELPVGESAIHEVAFPFWWPEGAGKKRLIRVNLIDAKPYGFHPVLADYALESVQ